MLLLLCLQLEYINGEIWANIWQTECIARICPDSGKVKGWVLMHGLQRNLADRGLSNHPMDVLNGKAEVGTSTAWPSRVGVSREPISLATQVCKSCCQIVRQRLSCRTGCGMPAGSHVNIPAV